MLNCRKDFANFGNNIWLNAASEGPLPLCAAKALEEAIKWKSLPYDLTDARFVAAQVELKESIGRLINANPKEVILANSASYGIHLLANGINWKKGDEIFLMQNDFPTNIVPWLALEKKGVIVQQVKSQGKVLSSVELKKHITPKTKLFCISHVHTFTGYILEVEEFAKICKANNIIFVLNISQSVGSMPIDLTKLPIDAVVTAGYKWLCGPYGTGLAWMKPELRKSLILNQAYWTSYCTDEELQGEGQLKYKEVPTARKYDIFGTANFFNFVPFRAAIDYWRGVGLENVETYNQKLVEQFVSGLDTKKYQLISPLKGPERSSIIVISHKDKNRNKEIFQSLKEKHIYPAFWKGNIRFAPHAYNTAEEIKKLLITLNQPG